MTSHPSKLAELAAPTRGRVKYAPLTAGLLARKGEAMPAMPYFAAEALDLYAAGPIAVARHEPTQSAYVEHVAVHYAEPSSAARRPAAGPAEEHHYPSAPPRVGGPWRIRRPVLAQEERIDAPVLEQHGPKPLKGASGEQASAAPDAALRIAVSLDIDLDLTARLAAHARHAGRLPARIVEEALKSHLAVVGDVCPTCARSLGESANHS